ncbi:MAG: HAMP domain-containing sensor histidine kinase [Candidatus Pacebacteria bacterium]|nr:HAMP domain-containing sensor histidine kinase [Candidatus Paceibacterota bacterium]
MILKTIADQLNIAAQCRKYNLSLWQCPQFIFLVMGLIIIFSSLFTYAIGTRYISDPYMVAIVVLLVASILFVLSTIISHSFDKLAEASRMKTEFVNIVSHQLRSPLSNLKWVIELLFSGRIGAVSEKQTEYFKILKENSSRMEELISDLLIVSRIEQGRFPQRKEKIFLKDIVQGVIKNSEIFARASNVQIEFKAENDLPSVFNDPSQAKLIVENLVDNAIRYTKERGKVEVSLVKKKNHLILSVKDSGVGIPKNDQKYIFQKFFRSANALKHQTEGSGLGLYITRSIIEKFNGRIKFNSQEGVGSTFLVTLPIK